MDLQITKRLGGASAGRIRKQWAALADRASDAEPRELRTMRGRARALKREVDRLIHVADGRLNLPHSSAHIPGAPLHADWSWQPPLWSGPVFPSGAAEIPTRYDFGPETSVYHDCHRSEITVRQLRNQSADAAMPFGLLIDVFRFEGSFLSLVLNLPDSAIAGLSKRHILGLTTNLEVERDIEIFARLNVRHGPNTEQIVREIPAGTTEAAVEFDLAYSDINEKRIERAWVDLIFEGPEMNAIRLNSMSLARWPRAEM